MSDRELLQDAAKAAGIDAHWGDGWQSDMMFIPVPRPHSPLVTNVQWNPLADDGDALRLAVRCGIVVEYRREVPACFAYHYALKLEVMQRNDELDPYAATRRAIVRAAAEIGRQMND